MYSEQFMDDLRHRLPEFVRMVATPSRKAGRDYYYCPLPGCDSGTKGKHTGAFHVDPNQNVWHCFSCGEGGDIVKLAEELYDLEFVPAVQRLSEELHMTPIEENKVEAKKKPTEQRDRGSDQELEVGKEKNYTEYYKTCESRVEQAAGYLASRGISIETAKRYHLGYDPAADPANDPAGQGSSYYPTPRLIIPFSKSSYLGRATSADAERQKAYPKGSSIDIFNAAALYKEGVVFIAEGALDALSIIEVGYPAAALNGAGNTDKLLETFKKHPPKARIILTGDRDNAGAGAIMKLEDGLNELKIPYLTANTAGKYKDSNEFLTADRKSFEKAVRRSAAAVDRPDAVGVYADLLLRQDMERFKAGGVMTGFSDLDKIMKGFFPGLYCITAIPSLGKTTFCWQCADQIATSGREAVYISLEQSRLDLVSKSIARRIGDADPFTRITETTVKEGLGGAAADRALDQFLSEVGNRLSIVDGNFDLTIDYIEGYLRRYVQRTGTGPICFIDYMQLVQAPNKKDDIRLAMDEIAKRLRRLSRELNIPIVAVSSMNRGNYQTVIALESVKESGGIEYGADGVYGLQLSVLHDKVFNEEKKANEKRQKADEAKGATPREIEFVALKHRTGKATFTSQFYFYSAQARFTEFKNLRSDPEGML